MTAVNQAEASRIGARGLNDRPTIDVDLPWTCRQAARVAHKADLAEWIIDGLTDLGGSGTVVEVSRWIWEHHQADLSSSGDLFYTWQYDVRWSAQKLRDAGTLMPSEGRRPGWVLSPTDARAERGRR